MAETHRSLTHPIAELIYKGILLGIITAISIGPVFFTIIETSINRGYRHGISIALGVLFSDAIIITACFLSIVSLIQNGDVRNIIGALGGSMLIMFGIYQIMHPIAPAKSFEIRGATRFSEALFMIKGFVINTLNPFVFIYWISAISLVSINHEYTQAEKVVLFSTAVMCNFGGDLLKTFLAIKLKHIMTPRIMKIITTAVGFGIIYFGVRLLWRTLNL